MKLVIDIEKEWYERACKANFSLDGALPIYQAIKEGTPYEERPHGEWIDLSDGWQEGTYECSNCKTEFVLIEGTPEDNEYNFCPNCGASMRKEGEQK